MRNILLIRKSHLGDVIITEPIARYFKQRNYKVFLATDYIHAKHLLKDTYAGFIKFESITNYKTSFDNTIYLTYENTPNLTYIEGYANSANIILDDNMPLVNMNWDNIINTDYALIAPNTSNWIINMRNWGITNFINLKYKIENELNIPAILLDNKYNFIEMLSLIRHCKFLIGNDSAPTIISQCFRKNTFVIFGPTNPNLVLFTENATAIFNDAINCIGCKHISRHTKIQCASPFCMSDLSVDVVFSTVYTSLYTHLS